MIRKAAKHDDNNAKCVNDMGIIEVTSRKRDESFLCME
jgi:hypothetical protein